jgi:hypothetical protein
LSTSVPVVSGKDPDALWFSRPRTRPLYHRAGYFTAWHLSATGDGDETTTHASSYAERLISRR